MTDVEVMYEDFIASRRSGRRNAVLPVDTTAIQGGGPSTSGSAMELSHDLSHDLAQLTVDTSGDEVADPRKSQDPTAKDDEEEDEEVNQRM